MRLVLSIGTLALVSGLPAFAHHETTATQFGLAEMFALAVLGTAAIGACAYRFLKTAETI